jgi:hypothetical protein
MFLSAAVWQALLVVGIVGGITGFIGGFIGNVSSLVGAVLMGVIGGIVGATMARIGGAPGIYTVGDGFSLVWSGVGGLVLGFVMGKAT